MNEYGLNDEEIINSLLINDKQRFIDKLEPLMDKEVYDDISSFFKSHANLENKIEWQKTDKDPQTVLKQIYDLMKTTRDKKKEKSDIKSLFKDRDNFKIIGEDNNFVYVAPLTWDACVFIDSYKCGGQGATWCIGWEQSNEYWKKYIEDGYVFVLMMSKHNDGSILEQLRMSDEIDDYEIYDLDNYDYEGGDFPDLRYPNDNKVMFQIKGEYVTAWEQTDDFELFKNQSMERIIEDCELGFEWDYYVYYDIYDEIKFKVKPECLDGEDDYYVLDYETYLDSGDNSNTINTFLENLDKKVSLRFVGGWNFNVIKDIIVYLNIDVLDLSEVTIFNEYPAYLGDMFDRVYCIDYLDVSCLTDINTASLEGFFDGFDDLNPSMEIKVNPNNQSLIDYINNYNEQNGTDIQIIMDYDTSDQLSFDFGE